MINEHSQITLFTQTISLFVSKLACVSFNPTRKVDLSFFAQLTSNRLGYWTQVPLPIGNGEDKIQQRV